MDLLKSIFKGDKVIWIIFLFLCLISITEVFSAASTLTYKSGDHWGPITQHSIILMVGAVIVVLMHNIPYKWFQVFPGFCHTVGAGHDDGTHQWCGALDDIHGHTVPTFGDCKNGGYHCHSLHPFQGARRRRSPSKGI